MQRIWSTSWAVWPNAIAEMRGWIRLDAWSPMTCAPSSRPVERSATTFAKLVVSSSAQP